MAVDTGPLPPDLNRAGKIMASVWAPFPFTVFLLASRMYVRTRRRRIGLDDAFMVIAWLVYFTNLILLTVVAHLGGFKHIEYVSPSNRATIAKLNLASDALGLFAAFFAKSSVALFLSRVLGKTKTLLRYFLFANIVIYGAISIAGFVPIWTQCNPLKALWESQLIKEGRGNCKGHEANIVDAYLQGSFGGWMDFMLALMPIPIIFQLDLTNKTRLGLCALMGLGVFAGVCAIVKTIEFDTENSDDPTWVFYALVLWATLEIPLTIIAGCVPPSKPLYDAIFKGKPVVNEEFKQRNLDSVPSIVSLAGLSNVFRMMRGQRLNSSDARTTHGGNKDTSESRNDAHEKVESRAAATDSIVMKKTITVEESSASASVGSREHEAISWHRDPPADRT